MSDIVLDTQNVIVNKMDKNPTVRELTFLIRGNR